MVKISSSSVSHGNQIASYYDIIHRKQGNKVRLFIGGNSANFLRSINMGLRLKS